MANPAQIEQELREFLKMEDNIRRSDRLEHLMAIVNKHFALDKIDHIMTARDFDSILDHAKSIYKDSRIQIKVSDRPMSHNDVVQLLILDSFVGYLNHNNLLKKLVKFDYTE